MFKRIVLVLSVIFLYSQSMYSMGSSSSTSTHLRDSASDSESETTLNKSVIPEDIKSLMIYPESVSDADKKRYHKYFSDLPEKLKDMVMSLKKSHELKKHINDQEHVVILVGPPSAGKSEGCKAIACELNWPYLFLSSTSFGTTYQNSAVQRMRGLIEPILKSDVPCVIIFDEITALTKGAHEGNDEKTVATRDTEQYKNSCELNSLLDKVRTNVNILFFGTTNDQELLSDPIQQRSKIVYCQSSTTARIAKLMDELQEDGTQIDQKAHVFLDSVQNKIGNLTYRDIEKLVKCIKRIAWKRQGYSADVLVIMKNDIVTALQETEAEIELANKAKNKKTEQRIMHEESIKTQKEQHRQNLEMQIRMFRTNYLTRPGASYSASANGDNSLVGIYAEIPVVERALNAILQERED